MDSQAEQQQSARRHLMAYAVDRLREWCGAAGPPPSGAGAWLEAYRARLAGPWQPPHPGDPLLSIFSRVHGPNAGSLPPQTYWRAAALSAEPLAPLDEPAARAADRAGLWAGFRGELEQVHGLPAGFQFESVCHLLHRWAWAVPSSSGEPGVSLYDEFRALSALVHASACRETPAAGFLLVAGDLPGIQRFVYTITSKGAAKGLRGRSFFLQLLGEALVRRLLDELELPDDNAVYAAGGNFLLLAPEDAGPRLEAVTSELNAALLEAFEGDLALCLAWRPLPAGVLGGEGFQAVSRLLHQDLGRQKGRRFAGQAWEAVFGPQGRGSPSTCGVCQHERRPRERGVEPEAGGWTCDQCHGFEELAQAIASPSLCQVWSPVRPAGPAQGWQVLLWELTRQWVDFVPAAPRDLPPGGRALAVGEVDFLAEAAGGFRLLARTTPRSGSAVRTFEELAGAAQGLEKVGVLRMDVDDLGRVFTQWLPGAGLAATAALSAALSRFFAGALDAICREVLAEPGMGAVRPGGGDLLYAIYAGGDDLFVVGAWHLMPLLAERIAQHFAAYAGGNPDLHISAGIGVEDRKFPLYRAAERAGEALDGAKAHTRRVGGRAVAKNAVSFLGRAAGWEEEGFPWVKAEVERLAWLIEERGVPRSLLTVLRAIHDRYYEDVRRARARGLEDERIHYGPWMWTKVYQLARIRQRYMSDADRDVREAIEHLERCVLTVEQMPKVGLATRWAEYLTRGGQEG